MVLIQNNFTFREASMEDKEGLKKLGLASYGQLLHVLTVENRVKLNHFLNDIKTYHDLLKIAKTFVCVDSEEIIGMVFIIPSGNPWDIFEAEWSYIRMLGVHPEYQGRGLAKTLIKMCIAHAKTTNENTIALHTSEFMEAARHLYEYFGFQIKKEIEPRLGKKYWLYTMDLKE